MWVITHEAGHLMDLKDHAGEIGDNEIMGPYLAPVTDLTITRILSGGDGVLGKTKVCKCNR
jgi:hypothetical protein